MARIAIIGAGVLGASVAWRLAQADHQVTVYDPVPGGVASPGSFAWLNASFAEDPVYNRLRHDSLEAWVDLKQADPGVPVTFPGALLWEQDHFDLPAILESQNILGRDAEMMSPAQSAEAEPALATPPGTALMLSQDGYGDPAEITEWFMQQAVRAGAVMKHETVEKLNTSDGVITGVQTPDGNHPCDHVILCAGIGLPAMLDKLGLALQMHNEPGMLVTTTPAPNVLNAMLATPKVHVWQRQDGRYLMGADFGGSLEAPDPEGEAKSLTSALKDLLPNASDVTVESTTVRERPKPVDGRPAIGPLGPKGLYIVSTHSGMTLAPLIGQMVAHEITTSNSDPRLSPYRPDRKSLQGQP